VSGFALGLPFLVLLRLVDHDSTLQIVLLVFLLLFIGIALSFVIPPLMVEMTLFLESVEAACPGMLGYKGAYALTYGFFSCAFAAGTTIGPLFAGLIKNHAGWGTMSWSLGLMSGVSAIIMVRSPSIRLR
jgi:MFS family permease